MISGARLGEWYERHNLTNPNIDWTYPPSDVSYERYDLMCPTGFTKSRPNLL